MFSVFLVFGGLRVFRVFCGGFMVFVGVRVFKFF